MSADPRQLEPDHLPTPFSAAEIQAACPPGRILRYRIERTGEASTIRVTRYVSVDAKGATRESWQEAPDGSPLADPELDRETWLELQRHASFPIATTRRDEETIDIPAGCFACLRYARRGDDGTWRFWFARDLPGQPVRYEHVVDGRVRLEVTLLENIPGPGD